jgi:hypothetical protein
VAVLVYPREDEVWFLVRHGEAYRRDESLEGRTAATVCYRPAKYDVVVFDRRTHELRLNGWAPWQRRLYRTQFGLYLFDDADRFREIPRYTLEPLREDEENALVCFDVEGLEWVRLRQLEVALGDDFGYSDLHKAHDLFAYWRFHGRTLPKKGQLVWAKFDVKFADGSRPRSVEIRAPYQAKFKRDDDSALVERWLSLRGFRLHVRPPLLASA